MHFTYAPGAYLLYMLLEHCAFNYAPGACCFCEILARNYAPGAAAPGTADTGAAAPGA